MWKIANVLVTYFTVIQTFKRLKSKLVDLTDLLSFLESTVSSDEHDAREQPSELPVSPDDQASVPIRAQEPDAEAEPDADTLMADFVATGKPEEIRQYFAERRRARAELVQDQMRWEGTDPTWSADLAQRFEGAGRLVPGLSGMSLAEADCRQTICAVRIGFAAGTSYKQFAPFMEHVGTVLGSDAWVHHDAEPDGAVVYVARPNASLPDVGQSGNG